MSKQLRRPVDIVVISDVHLGTYGCHAKELLHYMKSIKPKTVILNGDFIDIWQFSKRYWPKSHMKVIRQLMIWITKKVKIYYITGNHDEMLRRFTGFKTGSFQVIDKLVLDLPCGRKAWFFHGDVFDVTMQHSRWLAKLGAIGYDSLILLNGAVNVFSEKILKKGRISLSKKIKNSVKSALKFINDFETTAAEIAVSAGYDIVVCGHIHQPVIKSISFKDDEVLYLNSGDWIENLTALEYNNNEWTLYRFDHLAHQSMKSFNEDPDPSTSELFENMLREFQMVKAS